MTTQHLLYIPVIFLLGMVFGTMLPRQTIGTLAAESRIHKRKLLQAFLIFLLVFVITHIFEIPGGAKSVARHLGGYELFDKQPSFSASDVYVRINAFTDYGLTAYKRFTYTIDIIFPLSFFFFLLTFARFVTARVSLHNYLINTITYIPIVWFLNDMVENAIIFNLLSYYPKQINMLASSLGVVTVVKFTLLVLSLLAPIALLISRSFIKDLVSKPE